MRDGCLDGVLSMALMVALRALGAARCAGRVLSNAWVHRFLDNGAASGVMISQCTSTTLSGHRHFHFLEKNAQTVSLCKQENVMHKRERRCTKTQGQRHDGAAHLPVPLHLRIKHQGPTARTFRRWGVHDETSLRSGAVRRRVIADRRRFRRRRRHPCLWCTCNAALSEFRSDLHGQCGLSGESLFLTGPKRLETALTFSCDHLAFRTHSATLHSATANFLRSTISNETFLC